MTPTTGQTPAETTRDTDLVAAVHQVLADSPEPLTLSKIRSQLPAPFRSASLDELADVLHRQVAANVFYSFPKYRSQQERFWDRPLNVHIAALLRQALAEGPLAWSELRRRLPGYAAERAEEVLLEEVAHGRLYRHPRGSKRGGDRFGGRPADPKDYLRSELVAVFRRLEQLGFQEGQLRAAAMDLLHEEEWAPTTVAAPTSTPAVEMAPTRPETTSGAQPERPGPPAPSSAEAPAAAELERPAPAGPQGQTEMQRPTAPPPDSMPALEQAETHPDAPDAVQQ